MKKFAVALLLLSLKVQAGTPVRTHTLICSGTGSSTSIVFGGRLSEANEGVNQGGLTQLVIRDGNVSYDLTREVIEHAAGTTVGSSSLTFKFQGLMGLNQLSVELENVLARNLGGNNDDQGDYSDVVIGTGKAQLDQNLEIPVTCSIQTDQKSVSN